MEPLFQHLKPAQPPEDDREARKMLGTLEDLDRHVGAQCAPRLVTSAATGRKVLADISPYDRHYPSSVPSGGGVEARLRSVTNRLEGVFDLPANPHRLSDRTETLVLGFAAGVANDAPWAVSHLGGQSWRCKGGRIRGGGVVGNEVNVADADLSIEAGFIGFWARLSPFANTAGNSFLFRIEAGRLEAKAEYVNAGPTRANVDEADDFLFVWTPGVMFVPVAYVEAPTSGRRSRIIQMQFGEVIFPDNYATIGLPAVN
jgi:hypothetical protein